MKKSHSYMDNSQISMDCMIRTDKCWYRIQTQVPHTSLCYKHMQIFAMKKSVTENMKTYLFSTIYILITGINEIPLYFIDVWY